jgi:hypothetical protein
MIGKVARRNGSVFIYTHAQTLQNKGGIGLLGRGSLLSIIARRAKGALCLKVPRCQQ